MEPRGCCALFQLRNLQIASFLFLMHVKKNIKISVFFSILIQKTSQSLVKSNLVDPQILQLTLIHFSLIILKKGRKEHKLIMR